MDGFRERQEGSMRVCERHQDETPCWHSVFSPGIAGFDEENDLEKEREQTIKRYNAVRLGRDQALATVEALSSPPISRIPVNTNMSRYTKELASEQQNSSLISQKRTLFFNPVVKGDVSEPLLDREQPNSLNTAEEKSHTALRHYVMFQEQSPADGQALSKIPISAITAALGVDTF
jgi:hypothetical protein